LCSRASDVVTDSQVMSDPGPAPAIEISVDSSIKARAMALLFLAGGTIGAISMVLPHWARANEPALWSNVAVAYLAGWQSSRSDRVCPGGPFT